MNKISFIKQYTSFLTKADVVIVAGKPICQELSNNTNLNTFCFDDDCGYGISLALGMAMGTKKRVYIICEDHYLLKDLGAITQMGVSKLKNLFVIMIVTGYHPFTKNMPTITTSIPNIKGLLFSSGFIINDYTAHFKTQATAKNVKSWIATNRGPLAIFMYPDKTKDENTYYDGLNYSVTTEQMIKLKETLKNESTALFTPPFIGVGINETGEK